LKKGVRAPLTVNPAARPAMDRATPEWSVIAPIAPAVVAPIPARRLASLCSVLSFCRKMEHWAFDPAISRAWTRSRELGRDPVGIPDLMDRHRIARLPFRGQGALCPPAPSSGEDDPVAPRIERQRRISRMAPQLATRVGDQALNATRAAPGTEAAADPAPGEET
jgi:hypothetical protein